MMHRLDPNIIRAYDIRGVVGANLSCEDAYIVGYGLGLMIRSEGYAPRACIGRDGRLSSPPLAEAAAAGLQDTGTDVIDVGLGPTPMLYFAVHDCKASGGLAVTGSHNPPDYNGFKLMLGQRSLHGQHLHQLVKLAESSQPQRTREPIWHNRTNQVRQAYVKRLLRDFNKAGRPLNVAWDCGNGAAGSVIHELIAGLPGHHILLFPEVDGSFPNHHPDPTRQDTLADLIKTVHSEKLDLGIAFDGDGDRIGVIDDCGRPIEGDRLLAILAADVLIKQPGARIIADVKASEAVFQHIAQLGGHPEMWNTGHSLIKERLYQMQAPLAGEMSGHIFFADRYYGFDDALYAAIRLIEFVGLSGKTLSQLADALPRRASTPEIRIPCPYESIEERQALVDMIAEATRREGLEICTLDGVRAQEETGWWLLRVSNTEPVFVVRCEAIDHSCLDSLKNRLRARLEDAGINLAEGALE